jgi:DNA-binding transcriptional LysR family regulator
LLAGIFSANDARRRVVVELAHGLGIGEAVAAGELLCCVPKRLAASLEAGGLVQSADLPFESPRIDVSQFWHERLHADQGHRWFRGLVYRAYSAL